MARLDLILREHLDPELRNTLEAFERACPDFNPGVFQALGQNPELFIGYGRLIAMLDLEEPVVCAKEG